MSENRESPLVRARRELDAFEAAVFQFGQQMRAFLNTFPADLPEPLSALPRFRIGGGATSYAHLTFAGPDEVEAWANRLGVPVTRSFQAGETMAFVHAQGVLDGLTVFVGCMTTPTEDELRQARLRDVTEDGAQ